MPKNIVICCDGTSNQYSVAPTNVVRFYAALIDDGARQITYYHPGLGTMGPLGALTKFDKWWTRTLGLALGRGLEDDIRDLYCFLMQTYEPDDRIFLFGFSRGAYTVRCLASMLHLYGIIRRNNQPLVPYAIRMMVEIGTSKGDVQPQFALAASFKKTFSRDCCIAFVGVWDTVSSVGWIANPLSLPFTAYNPSIKVGRHAVSIDERRAFFRTNLWRPPSGSSSDIKQVWFPGSHGDVGGGYPEEESAQSKYALSWMLNEARENGLLIDQSREDEVLGRTAGSPCIAPAVNRPLHDALRGWWRVAEFVPKKHFNWKKQTTELRMNLFRRRTIPSTPAPLVHVSARLRGQDYLRRVPSPHIIVS